MELRYLVTLRLDTATAKTEDLRGTIPQDAGKIAIQRALNFAMDNGIDDLGEGVFLDGFDVDDSTAVENNHTAPDDALHVATLPAEKRYRAESLLAKVIDRQTAYWDTLRDLEEFLDFEIDSTQDFRDTDLDTILANPGPPV